MQEIALFALLGLGSGALIAGVALGVVLTFRGSGVINLSVGAVAMVGGYVFWALKTGFFGFSLPTVPALIGTMLAMVALGVAIELLAFRPLRRASTLAKLISSVGVLLILQAVTVLVFGTEPVRGPSILPEGTVSLFSITLPVDRFYLAGIVVVVAVILALIYRFSVFGVATRAASESEPWAQLFGLSPDRLSMINTVLSTLVSGALGVLVASITSLDTSSLPLVIVPALTAALFARFTSFGIACAAGLLLGMAQSVLYYLSTQGWFPTDHGNALPGVEEMLIFALMVVALLWRGASLPRRGDVVEQRLPAAPRLGPMLRPTLVVAVVVAVALVILPFDFRQALTASIIGMVFFLSAIVITGYVGQLSVVQLALSGVSGFAVSHLAVQAGIGFPLGAILGALIATVLGVAIGFSALRVRGATLAVLTLAAAVAIEQFVFSNQTWGGAGAEGSLVPSPHIFGLDIGVDAGFRGVDGLLPSPIFGFFVLIVAAVMFLLVANLRRADLGQQMVAVRSNERAAAAAGINVARVKLIAFGLGSLIAGIAGTLYAYNFGVISVSRFDVIGGVTLIAIAYVSGIGIATGAVFAGLASTGALMPYITEKWVLPSGKIGIYTALISGVLLIVQLRQFPDGAAGTIFLRRQERRAKKRARAAGSGAGDASDKYPAAVSGSAH